MRIDLPKKAFMVGLFLLPFVFWSWAKVPFEVPKVWVFNRWVEILGVLATVTFMSKSYWVKGDRGNKGNGGSARASFASG